ncbi:MAG: response regulator [Pseudomonadota bacterium]
MARATKEAVSKPPHKKGAVTGKPDAERDRRPGAKKRSRRTGVLTLTFVGLLVAASIGSFLYFGEENTEQLLLFQLGVLAVIGIFTLFAGAVGLVHFGDRRNYGERDYSFLESLDGAHVVADSDGRILFADQAYRKLTGTHTEQDLRSVERVFGLEEGASEPVYRLSIAAEEGRSSSEEVRIEGSVRDADARDDKPRWYRISVRSVRGADAQRLEDAPLTIWRIEDITRDREDQEVAFRELQNVINYLDHAPAGFFSAEPDGKIIYMNATLAGWIGMDLAEFDAGRVFLHDIVRGDGAALLNAIRANPGDVHTETIDIDLVKTNGQSLPVRLLHLTPFQHDGAPGPTRTIVLNRTKIAVGDANGVEDQARFSRFFHAAPIAIAAIDHNGNLARANAPFIQLFGREQTDAPGMALIDLVPAADRPKLNVAVQEALSGKGEISPVDVGIDRDGGINASLFISAVSQALEEEEDSASEAAVVYAIDTTQQRALEQQFVQGQKMQAIGQLAGGIAHDFNNLLTAIIGFSDLLLQAHGPTDPSFQDLMNIKNNANRAAGLVRQLLAFSRRQTLRPTVIDLHDVIEDLSILLERLLGENVRLEVKTVRDLWAIKADFNQLEQVIINLSVNARDAMPDGGTLTISTRNFSEDECDPVVMKGIERGEYVLIEVADTGTGMTAEVMEKIFEPFFSTKDVGEGTGLGLATVYGIIKQTEGYIYPISEVGVGTTFKILLPRHIRSEKDEAKAEQTEVPRDLSGSARILLVEDEEAVRAFSARALQARGHTVHEAASGVEALEVMEEVGGEIDLVVSDVVMPEMDGPTLLTELRKMRPDLKIIFVSGYAEEAFEKHLAEDEAFAFLPKPFSLKQLATKVKEVLDGTDES